MNNQVMEILNATNKCILITCINNNVNVTPCNYSYRNNNLFITFNTYNTAIKYLTLNDQATLYITVCDHSKIYYLIIEGTGIVSSTSFNSPSLNNLNSNYKVCINIENATCYYETI